MNEPLAIEAKPVDDFTDIVAADVEDDADGRWFVTTFASGVKERILKLPSKAWKDAREAERLAGEVK